MIRTNIRKMKKHFGFNKKLYILPITCLIIGAILGTTVSLLMTDEKSKPVTDYLTEFFSAYSLQGADRTEIFKSSLHNNLKMLIVLWVSGLSAVFIPFLIFYIGLKGFKIGFTVSFLIKNFSYSGAWFSVASMLTQVAFVVPFIILYSVYSIRLTSKIRLIKDKRMNNTDKKNLILSNFTALVISVAVLLFASLSDSIVVPLICTIS